MIGHYILDADHNIVECDLVTWVRWMEENRLGDKVVQQDTVGDVWLSTVFLGLDHGWDNGPPVLFETMSFGKKKGKVDFLCEDICERYCTWDEALAGHRVHLASLRAAHDNASWLTKLARKFLRNEGSNDGV